MGAWTEPELDPGSGQTKLNRWTTRTFSKLDAPGALQELAALGVGQPSNPSVSTATAVAAIPGVGAAVLLASGSTVTNDTGDVLRGACLSAQGAPLGLVTIADDPEKSRTGIELRQVTHGGRLSADFAKQIVLASPTAPGTRAGAWSESEPR